MEKTERLVQYTAYLEHLSLSSCECYAISNAKNLTAINDNTVCGSHCLT